MKPIAVIILNWNGRRLLEEFIPAAVRHTITPIADLWVADNGSTDDSLAWLADNYPEVKVLSFKENLGFAEGYNRALRETGYRYTVLLNSDVEVTPGWVEPLYRFMEEHPECAACQPKILSYRDKSKFEYAGAAGGLLDKNGYPYCRGRLFDAIETDEGQYDNAPAEICWASGAALTVDTKRYFEAGGLDKDFFAHMEEIDLCCRLIGRGWKVFVVPQSKVYHVGGASLNQGNPKKTYLNFRNNLLLLHKNLPEKAGKKKLFWRRLLDTLAFGMFILKGDIPNARAILRAHSDFRKMKRKYTAFPQENYLARVPGADRNILIDYYIKGKKICVH